LQLGDLHSDGYISDLFAKTSAIEGVKAYVELIRRKERELGTDMLTPSKGTHRDRIPVMEKSG
jgi:isocitrate lyase